MTDACSDPLVWRLSRRGRDLLYWDVDGLPEGAAAHVRLEDGSTWRLLGISTERDRLSTYVAGPDFTDPGDVLVVSVTSRAEIRVVSGLTTVFLDGGYIELTA